MSAIPFPRPSAQSEDVLRDRVEELESALLSVREAQRVANVGSWDYVLAQNRLSWSPEVHSILGADPAAIVANQESALAFVHPDDRNLVDEAWRRTFREHLPFDVQHRIIRTDGEIRHLHQRGELRFDDEGRIHTVAGIIQDVTERNVALERLTESEKLLGESSSRLHNVLEGINDAFCTLDREWRFTYLNRACEQLLERPRGTLLGKLILEEFPGEAGEVFWQHYRRALQERRDVEFEAPYGPLGVWVEVRAHPTEEGLAISLRDVTERRREKETLRQSMERFRGVARATSDAVWDWNLETDEVWWSGSVGALLGHPLSEPGPAGAAWASHIHDEDRDRAVASIFAVVEGDGEEWSGEYRFLRSDGTSAWVHDRAFVIRDASGRAVRMVGGMSDLTERRRADLELARLNRALRMRNACNESLVRATNETDLLTDVCRIAVEIGGYRMTWVGYAEDDDARTIRQMAHAGTEDRYLSTISLSWAEDRTGGGGPAGRAIRSGAPEVVEDLARCLPQTSWHQTARELGYHGVICLPLRDRQDTFGLLSLYTAEIRPVTEDEVTLLQQLADDLAFGVVSLRSRRDRERMQLAVSQMASVVSADTKEEFFQQLVSSMCEALGADAGYVATFPAGRPHSARTITAVLDGRVTAIGDPLAEGNPCGALFLAEEAVIASGVAERYPRAAELTALGAQAWVGRRLNNARGVPVGIVAAVFREPIADVAFATSTLRIFAARATAELERHHLESLKAQQTGILERIAAGASLSEVTDAATRLVESHVSGATCATSLVDEEGGVLRLLAGHSLVPELRGAIATVKIGPVAGTCGTAAHERRTVIVASMATDPLTAAYSEVTARCGIRAGWAVPFFASDSQILGTFTVYLPVSRQPDADELDLVATSAHLIGIAVERERSHDALRASEERVRSTFAAAAAGIAISSLEDGGLFEMVNQAFCDLVGYTEEELQHLDPRLLTHPDDFPETFEWYSRLIRREVDKFVIEKRYLRKNGEIVWARVSVSTVPSGDGGIVHLIAVTEDITALKAAEQLRQSLESQLREAQKMEAIGTLAGGIAHDFNNILGAILGNAELARLDVEDNAPALQSLAEIRRAGLQAKELIRQILSFSRRDKSVRRPVALLPIVEESARLLRATLPSRAPIEVRADAAVPFINADPVQLQQVVLNLGTNAVHAMDGRPGAVEIRVDSRKLDETATRLHPDLRAGVWVRLSIVDAGHGMDETTRRRIFEPFFTTKPVGEGTGLGLPVVHGIVRDHEGIVVVESAPGVGTRFDLYFPASEAAREEIPAPAAPRDSSSRTAEGAERVVLYVDDDASLLLLIQRLLRRRGYEVVGHVDAQAAIDEVRADPGRFDLILTDYNMPKLSGVDVARTVRGIQADLPVAIISGYITESIRAEAEAAGVRALIFKPDVVEALCDEVTRVICEFGKRRQANR